MPQNHHNNNNNYKQTISIYLSIYIKPSKNTQTTNKQKPSFSDRQNRDQIKNFKREDFVLKCPVDLITMYGTTCR